LKYWNGSRVEAEGRMARSEGGASPSAGCNDRATPPAALLPRAVDGCVDFGVDLRCSLGRDHCGYRHCASRLGQRQNPQQRDPSRYFNSLVVDFISHLVTARRLRGCIRGVLLMLVILLLIDSCYSRLRGFRITETRRLVRQSFSESSGHTGCFALDSL
jgi:hypothetical protein